VRIIKQATTVAAVAIGMVFLAPAANAAPTAFPSDNLLPPVPLPDPLEGWLAAAAL
jgi:hypothetical protein